MHISLIILTPILICVWIYFLIIITENLLSSPPHSLHLNIVNTNAVIQNTNLIQNDTNGSKMKTDTTNNKNKKSFHVPKFMLELYEKNLKEGKNSHKSDVVKSLIPTHADSFHDNEVFETYSQNHLLIFNIPSSDENERFMSAELKILTLLDIKSIKTQGMHGILKVSIYDQSMKELLNFQEVPMYHIDNTWVSFDVTEPVEDVLKSDKKVFSVVLTVSAFLPEFKNNVKLSLMPEEENFEHDYPVLLLSYSSSSEKNPLDENASIGKRTKRSIEDDYEEETNKLWDDEFSNKKALLKKVKKLRNSCKKKPLYVDFAEISYDTWIVQPKGYEAYQCQGRCFYPVADHLNPTKHAIVQAMLHNVSPSKVSRSCCVPTALDSISILYVDSNGVLTYRYAYKDMVVLECGCSSTNHLYPRKI